MQRVPGEDASQVRAANAGRGACSISCHTRRLVGADVAMRQPPSTPWFCDSCLTNQASGILEFLEQTRRILIQRMAKEKALKDVGVTESGDSDAGTAADENGDNPGVAAAEKDTETSSSPGRAEARAVDVPESSEPNKDEDPAKSTPETEVPRATAEDDLVGDILSEAMDGDAVVNDAVAESQVIERISFPTVRRTHSACEEVRDTVQLTPRFVPLLFWQPEQRFLALIDSLIDEVSSKKDRMVRLLDCMDMMLW